MMKINRGEKETSETFKKRGGVTPDIKRGRPKNVRNERVRKTKKKRKSVQPIVHLQSQNYLHTEPTVASWDGPTGSVLAWFATYQKGLTLFCISWCVGKLRHLGVNTWTIAV